MWVIERLVNGQWERFAWDRYKETANKLLLGYMKMYPDDGFRFKREQQAKEEK